MSLPRRIAGLSALLLIAVLSACGDDGGSDATATPSSAPTITTESTVTATSPVLSSTATPSASPTAFPLPSPTPEAPHAAPIELDPEVKSLGEDVLLPVLQPQSSLLVDPVALAEELEITTPPCADLIFYLSWQVRSPYPPTDVDIEVRWLRMGKTDVIGEDTSGQASGGCGEYRVVNNSSEVWATVEVRYLIGESSG